MNVESNAISQLIVRITRLLDHRNDDNLDREHQSRLFKIENRILKSGFLASPSIWFSLHKTKCEFIDESDLVFASAFNVCQYRQRDAGTWEFERNLCATALHCYLPLGFPVDPRCSTMYLTNDFRTNSPISNGRTVQIHPLAMNPNPCRPRRAYATFARADGDVVHAIGMEENL